MAKLGAKQARFVEEYLIDLNATQAAIRAGYSQKTAKETGYENLTKPHIAKAIQEAKDTRTERTQIDADYVLNRLVQIDEMDAADILNDDGSIKQIQEWPKVWRQYLSGMEITELFEGRGNDRELVGLLKKIKWPDKLKNLELLGKHIGVQAFKEKVESNNTNANTNLNVDASNPKQRLERIAELRKKLGYDQ